MLRGKDDGGGEEEEKNFAMRSILQTTTARNYVSIQNSKKQMRFFIVDMKHFSLRFDFEEITK